VNRAETRFVEGVYAVLEGAGVTFDNDQARAIGMGLGTLLANYNVTITRNQAAGVAPWVPATSPRPHSKG